MEIAPYYTYKPPLKLALDLNILLDVDTLNFSDYSYIYGQLNHIILDFEEVNGFLERFNHLKKMKPNHLKKMKLNNDKPNHLNNDKPNHLNNDKPNHLNNNKFSIKESFKKFIPRKLL